ncbi:MAG TPA: NYN domain-containing protein [Pseudonocardiaceae bacterium]
MPATHSPAGPNPPDPAGSADGETAVRMVDWDTLPDAIRLRLADVAAGAVARIPGSDLPVAVRPVARFAPAKRARLGGAVLLAGLRDSPAFRTAVTEWARMNRPDLLDLTTADDASAAAAAVLLGAQNAGQQVAEVARRAGDAQLRAERAAVLAKMERVALENRRLRGELDTALAAARDAGTAGDAESDRLRSRLREQGVRLRQALDRADQAASDSDAELAELRRALAAAEAQRDRERERAELANHRAELAVAEAEAARQSVREARSADEVRLTLLLDTMSGAVAGLRRELALGQRTASDGPRPGDLISGGSTLSGVSGRVVDPATLDRLLALPAVHLVVDGYNVTKTGYPDLTLSDQRDRLIGQLAALAARTGAEITVVFDGAAVVAVPTTTTRSVRVLFSDPGVLADDVIRALVAAEPVGRPIVVVTSDRAVAESVRRGGAQPVPSAVLLTRLTR